MRQKRLPGNWVPGLLIKIIEFETAAIVCKQKYAPGEGV